MIGDINCETSDFLTVREKDAETIKETIFLWLLQDWNLKTVGVEALLHTKKH